MRISSAFRFTRHGLFLPLLSAFLLLISMGNVAHATGLEVEWSTEPETPILVNASTTGTVTANYVPSDPGVGEEETYTHYVTYTYSWSPGDGGTCTPADGASASISYTSKGDKTVTVTITATGSYTITDNEGNTRSVPIDETKTLIADIQVIEIKIEVKRAGTSSWGSSADIAAGGKSSDVHKADVKVELDPTPSSALDVTISVSGIAADGGPSGSAKSSLSLGDVSFSGTGNETASLTATETTGTFASSNKLGDITIAAGDQSTTVSQKWDFHSGSDILWNYPPTFEYDKPDPVSLTIELESGLAIDQHDLEFIIKEVSYEKLNLTTFKWEDNPGVTSNLKKYASFGNGGHADGKGDTQTTNGSGTATSSQTIYGSPGNDWTIFVYEVKFQALDNDARKP